MADETGPTTFTYYNNNWANAVQYPVGVQTTITAYNGNGKRQHMTDLSGQINYSYDADWKPKQVAPPVGQNAAIFYTPRGEAIEYSCPAATTESYVNPNGTLNHGRFNSVYDWVTFTYDPARSRTSAHYAQGNMLTTYTYDPTNQLLSENQTGTYAYAVTSTYDPLGNRLTVSRSGAGPLPLGVTAMTYNAANALILSQAPTGAPTTITYDANGNMALENANGSLTAYTWDGENRMTAVAYADGTSETYAYSADGKSNRRIRRRA